MFYDRNNRINKKVFEREVHELCVRNLENIEEIYLMKFSRIFPKINHAEIEELKREL